MNPQEILRIAGAVIAVPVAVALIITGCSASSGDSSSTDTTPPATSTQAAPGTPSVKRMGVKIVSEQPFNETSFTQGLEVEEDGRLLVGTGQKGASRIYRTTLDGQESNSHDLDQKYFGEGVTRHEDTVWQLTWQAGVAFKRDATTLDEISQVTYEGEGWGLCSFPDRLIMSDGTNELRVLNPDTFAEQSRISVTADGQEVNGINELECVTENGTDTVYANVFQTSTSNKDTDILKIDAASGAVNTIIDASTVPNNAEPDPNNVLNGIAHIPGTNQFYLTGKRWPTLYTVEFVEQ